MRKGTDLESSSQFRLRYIQGGPRIQFFVGASTTYRGEITPVTHLFSAIYRDCNAIYNQRATHLVRVIHLVAWKDILLSMEGQFFRKTGWWVLLNSSRISMPCFYLITFILTQTNINKHSAICLLRNKKGKTFLNFEKYDRLLGLRDASDAIKGPLLGW